jgi:hypothetical protein
MAEQVESDHNRVAALNLCRNRKRSQSLPTGTSELATGSGRTGEYPGFPTSEQRARERVGKQLIYLPCLTHRQLRHHTAEVAREATNPRRSSCHD